MAKSYLVALGINYGNRRAEPGDVIDDLPENAIENLLAMGAIAPYEKSGKGKA